MINPVLIDSVEASGMSRLNGWQQVALFLRLLRYAKAIWDKILLRMIITQLNAFMLAVPVIVSIRIFDEAFPRKDMSLFLELCLIAIVAILLNKMLEFIFDVMAVYGIAKLGLNIRIGILAHILHLSPRFYESRPVGEHMYRCVYDTGESAALANDAVPRLVNNLQKILTLAFVMATIRLWLLPVTAAYLLVFFVIKHYIATQIRNVDRKERREGQRVEAITREVFSAFKLVKGNGLERMVSRWYFAQVARKLHLAFLKNVLISFDMNFSNPAVGLAFPLFIFLLNYVAGNQILSGSVSAMTIGEYTGIAVLVSQLALPLQDAINLFQEVRRQLIPAERMMETFNVAPEVVDAPDAARIHGLKGHLQVENLTFAYNGVPVLRNISLEAQPGEKIAVVGPIGAGKTTLVRLLLRMMDPQHGVIRLDGLDLKQIQQVDLRKHIGVVPQSTILFTTSLAENIKLGSPAATRAQVERAARLAMVDEFVGELPNGYDSHLASGGLSLSGGQRQRVCVARALAKDAAVLILDEATSALDPMIETQVVEAIDKAYADRTRIVIAHNLLNARDADRIYVLDNGKIVETGTHEELMKANGRYFALWDESSTTGTAA